MAGGGSPREKMTYPACSPALCRDCGRPSCKSPRSLYGRGVGECAGAAGDRGCDFGAHDMNRSGDAACRRSCLQQPETLVRGLGPHRQDRLRILHPITYVIAILCFHGAARGWRQADMMRADGGEVRQRTVCRRRQRRAGRPARGERESAAGAGDGRVRLAAAAPGETLEGAVSAAVAEDGRRLSETVEDGRGRSRVVEDGRRHGGRGERSDKARRGPRDIYCCGGVAARGGGGVLPREPVRARPAVQDMLLQPRLLRGRLFS